MQVAFGRVRRKTVPTGSETTTVICSKIDSYGAFTQRTYEAFISDPSELKQMFGKYIKTEKSYNDNS